jgi:hypothetical protein
MIYIANIISSQLMEGRSIPLIKDTESKLKTDNEKIASVMDAFLTINFECSDDASSESGLEVMGISRNNDSDVLGGYRGKLISELWARLEIIENLI